MLATYRGPRKVFARLFSIGPREDRALVILMISCVIVFIAQWPRLSREAFETGQALNPLLGATLLAWVFIVPLALYVIAFLSQMLMRIIGRKTTGFATRMSLFWALFASTPWLLLHGLVAGFIGQGPALSSVGFVWLGFFLWFWIAGLSQVGRNHV